MREYRFTTPHGIAVTRSVAKIGYRKGLKHLLHDLDRHRGIYLSSGYEYPGRYSRWDIASTRPPIEIVSWDRRVEFRPLSIRGEILNQILLPVLEGHPHWESFAVEEGALCGRLKPLPALFPEEERSKQPSTFSILRALIEEFRGEEESGWRWRAPSATTCYFNSSRLIRSCRATAIRICTCSYATTYT